MTPLERALTERIRQDGPLSVEAYMHAVLTQSDASYYRARQPFGTEGDFVTAPEISPVFGEMIGLWAADFWHRAGRPAPFHLIEYGPGRGQMMQDALRACARALPAFVEAAQIHLVEASPARQSEQADKMPSAQFWPSAEAFAQDGPPGFSMIWANEFFDALPIRQYQWKDGAWHERYVGLDADGRLQFQLSPLAAPIAQPGEDAQILERSPARARAMAQMAARLQSQGGAALVIDYGHGVKNAVGDTLQAVRRHAYCDPLAHVGEADLTSHVDFAALAEAALGLPHRMTTQGAFLMALGLPVRLEQLRDKLPPERFERHRQAVERLVAPDAMGDLFKVMAFFNGPEPAGFA